MAKQINLVMIIIGVSVLIILTTGFNPELFAISEATMTRSVPAQASPGQDFEIVYSVSGASGKWGASIVDSVSGCKFPDGSNQLRTVMLSTEGDSKTIKIIAPSSGSCTFSGDYKFGTEVVKNFQDQTITIKIVEDGEELPSFDLKKPLFNIGDFEVTGLIIIVILGGGLVLSFFRK